MKRLTFFIFAMMVIGFTSISAEAFAQKFMTRNGHISFFSKTPLENIEAHNRQVNSALDLANADFVFRLLMKSFIFEKALMQEHFNENYVESDKFPNASFSGKVLNMSEIDFTKKGSYKAVVEGDLTIHGVTKKVKESGVFEIEEGEIRGKCTFTIQLKDYDVKIPKTVANNIAETIEIRVDVLMKKI